MPPKVSAAGIQWVGTRNSAKLPPVKVTAPPPQNYAVPMLIALRLRNPDSPLKNGGGKLKVSTVMKLKIILWS